MRITIINIIICLELGGVPFLICIMNLFFINFIVGLVLMNLWYHLILLIGLGGRRFYSCKNLYLLVGTEF